ncbi:alpha-latroinsectotoxin-Lt1a-like isoform X2 [Halichondria panicea]|uniref:alpha-latroinsectotoxin-Lt1a-like isoform X2 n=1 Tax=Halichondria panicea TaxID=6063 RepID=UPI00312B65E0
MDTSAQNKLAYDLWNVSYHDVVKVKSLLGQGADPNHQLYWSEKWYWEPPLHTACKWGRLEIVKTLVTHGARTDKGDGGDNMTPLHWACRGDCIEVVKYFIREVGCSIDVRDKYNKTSLHFACLGGSKDVVQYLVEEMRMDVDVIDDFGQSPLDDAIGNMLVSKVYVDVVLYLMSRGCCGDEDKADLLRGACFWGQLGVVKELVEQHKVDAKNVRSIDKTPPLINASGHKDVVQYLVEKANCDINVRDDEGQSLLDSALERLGYEDGCLDVALYLMSRGCSDEDKTKLLCRACECGKLGAVKEMVEKYKVDPKNVKDSEGQSPLDRALEFLYEYDDCVYVALYLMNRGCGGDEDIKDDLLYAACCKGKLELVKELIEQHEVNPMCKRTYDNGKTPLDVATEWRHTEIADYLKSLPRQSALTEDSDSKSGENRPSSNATSDPLFSQQTPSALPETTGKD